MNRTDIIKCHPEWLNDNTIASISDIDRLRVHVAICRQDVAHVYRSRLRLRLQPRA